MSNEKPSAGPDRRELLAAGVGLLGGFVLASRAEARLKLHGPLAARPGEAAPRTLVLLQLSGGNDGLSSVVPWADDAYHKARSTIRIPEAEVLKLDDYRGLHPALVQLRALHGQGRLAIVEGCGHPQAVRSHFKSMEIWHTASKDGRNAGQGWIGKLCDAAWEKDASPELLVHVGASAPYSLSSKLHPALTFQTPNSYKWVACEEEEKDVYKEAGEDPQPAAQSAVLARLRGVLRDANESSLRIRRAAAAYQPRAEYPADDFGEVLKVAAALVDARVGSRVISVELGGFDSHNNQRAQHDERMRRLDAGLGAFLEDIEQGSAGAGVLVLAFSEFGRRVRENGSRGTDHGLAGPMLVLGQQVRGGLYGRHPSLTELQDGDLAMTTDFRSVYGTLVERWFGVAQERVLGQRHPTLDFLPA